LSLDKSGVHRPTSYVVTKVACVAFDPMIRIKLFINVHIFEFNEGKGGSENRIGEVEVNLWLASEQWIRGLIT
jgi:hypothetical protein